jgi:excisionase family DNA binding protein
VQLLSAREVAARLAVSRPLLYSLIKSHGFPAPLKIGGRSAWRLDEVVAWIEMRSEARHG